LTGWYLSPSPTKNLPNNFFLCEFPRTTAFFSLPLGPALLGEAKSLIFECVPSTFFGCYIRDVFFPPPSSHSQLTCLFVLPFLPSIPPPPSSGIFLLDKCQCFFRGHGLIKVRSKAHPFPFAIFSVGCSLVVVSGFLILLAILAPRCIPSFPFFFGFFVFLPASTLLCRQEKSLPIPPLTLPLEERFASAPSSLFPSSPLPG